MDKLMDLVEEKTSYVFREALENAILISGMLLCIVCIFIEVVVGIALIILLLDNFIKALLFLIIDFVLLFISIFGAAYLKVWCENHI